MQLIIVEHDQKRVIEVQPDDLLLNVLRDQAADIHAPCGGRGTCRKCQVNLAGIGTVLSCQTRLTAELQQAAGLEPDQPLTVIMPEPVKAQISTDGFLPALTLSPLIYKGSASLPIPSLNDQRPDDERFEAITGKTVPFRLLGQLPAVLRDSAFSPAYYFRCDHGCAEGEVLRFVRPDSPEPLGVAVDIGTTTLAAYLYDLDSGRRLAAASALNPQSSYGADVISRIEKASESPELRQALKDSIGQAVAGLAASLVRKACAHHGLSITTADICHYVLAGNTTMMHLLAGLPPDAISRAPFIPVSRRTLSLQAFELGLPVAPDALCQLLPSISGYVGADITAGILACGLHRLSWADESSQPQPMLLLDIGTNGEIVLAGPRGVISCSTAAGPAFEGANILCGIGGVTGAIDEVSWQDDDLVYTLIGEKNGNGGNGSDGGNGHGPALARGICGSGLVAAVASLLDCGIVDETGRITDEPEDLPENLRRRIIEYNNQAAVLLVAAPDSATGLPIILTQKDIRELQNAKAAIAAGIALLIQEAGLVPEQIGQAYIAGGFGNYLDVVHAFRIGLLPAELRGRTRAVGNTSGMGAILCLLDESIMREAETVAATAGYFELSSDSRFVDLYIDAMMFPESAD